MAVRFCTFGSLPAVGDVLVKLEQEALQSGYFDSVQVYTQYNLPGIEWHADFIEKNPRGYGYWIWKPLCLLAEMEKAAEGDIILYADGGCGICTTDKARATFSEWISLVQTHPSGRVCFDLNGLSEEDWVKGDVLVALDCYNDDSILKTPQIMATILIFKVTDTNKKFIKFWYTTMMSLDDYHMITDAKSILPNAPGFWEHRHDQAVLSILLKRAGALHLSAPDKRPEDPIQILRRKLV